MTAAVVPVRSASAVEVIAAAGTAVAAGTVLLTGLAQSKALIAAFPGWPRDLYYLSLVVGALLVIGGVGLTRRDLLRGCADFPLGMRFERTGLLVLGLMTLAYACALAAIPDGSGVFTALLITGVSTGYLWRARQITVDLNRLVAALAPPGSDL